MAQQITAGSTTEYMEFSAGAGNTGLSSFTVKISNGGSEATFTTPTVTEIGNGKYAVLMDEQTSIGALVDRENFMLEITAAGMMDVHVPGVLVRDKISTGSTLTVATITGAADANVVQISGDSTAADNLESAMDGTGYDFSGCTVPWNSAWDAEVQSEVADALSAYNTVATTDLPSNFGAMNITVGGSVKIQTLVGSDIATSAFEQSKFATGFIVSSSFATDAIDADAIASDAVTEIQSGLATSSALATVDTNIDTLLTRIPAALFSGITSLAQWLGLIAGKQTGNSTARTELRATGAGSGTFDETADSLEAIRDNQGGGGGSGGSASNSILSGSISTTTKLEAKLVD